MSVHVHDYLRVYVCVCTERYLEKHERVAFAMDLLLNLLQFDTRKRLTAKEALTHPYFNRVRTEELETLHDPVHFAFEDQTLNRAQIRSMSFHVVCGFDGDVYMCM